MVVQQLKPFFAGGKNARRNLFQKNSCAKWKSWKCILDFYQWKIASENLLSQTNLNK